MTTKTKIVASATALLRKNGYKGWSYDDIAHEVGIKKASIYYYFPSKDILVIEVLKIYIENLNMLLQTIQRSSISSLEKLERFIDIYRSEYHNLHENCLCTILAADRELLPKEALNYLQKFNSSIVLWVTKILNDGVNENIFRKDLLTSNMAHVICGLMQGLLITGKFVDDKNTFELCFQQIMEMIR